MEFKGISEFNNWLLNNNFCILPNGVIFDQNKEDAIISKVIADVMNKRDEYKTVMKNLLKESNEAKANGDKELAKQKKEESIVADMNQRAVKVINNGIYGATSSESFRLFNLDVAESITTSGQVIIRNSRYIANKKLNEMCNTKDEDYIVTIDTDSLIFTMDKLVKYDITERRKSKLEEIAKIPCIIQSEVNTKIVNVVRDIFHKTNVNDDNNFLYIKNEWLADSGLFLAKKRYVIHQVFKEGIGFEQLSATGVDIKRSTTPKVFKTFLENILTQILSYTDKSIIDNTIITECDKLKNEYSLQDIAIPCGIHDMDEYDKVLPIHVRGAKIWNDFFAKSETDKITNGKIKYIYVKKWLDIPELNQMLHYATEPKNNNNKNIVYDDSREYWIDKSKPEHVISIVNDKDKWDMIGKRIEPDYEKMKERLILQPVTSFYDALGWSMPIQAISNSNCAFNIFG